MPDRCNGKDIFRNPVEFRAEPIHFLRGRFSARGEAVSLGVFRGRDRCDIFHCDFVEKGAQNSIEISNSRHAGGWNGEKVAGLRARAAQKKGEEEKKKPTISSPCT